MNKVLFKAAVILNIAVASLIYVACSGDDGEKGDPGPAGAGCTAVESTTVDGYDIMCGNPPVKYGSVQNGTAIAKGDKGDKGDPGEPGAGGCTITDIPGGETKLLACGNQTAIIGGSSSGNPQPGVCSMTPWEVPLSVKGDKGIQLSCGTDRTAYIITCPVESDFFTGGEYCDPSGKIGRGGSLILCGGETFNPRREFCQRTFSTGVNAGKFALAYPLNWTALNDTNNAYNVLEKGATSGVVSVKKPYCGGTYDAVSKTLVPIAGPDDQIPAANSPIFGGANSAIYDATQACAKNLVYRKDGLTEDLTANPAAPWTPAWSVTNLGNCFYNDQKGLAIQGKNGTYTPYRFEAGCSFFTVPEESPYKCPDATPLVELDNKICVARETGCTYHSSVDNTCYTNSRSIVIGSPKVNGTITIGGVSVSAKEATGIFAKPLPGSGNYNTTSIETSNFVGQNSIADTVVWSKACVVGDIGGTKRTVYYVVNDMDIVPKAVATGELTSGYAHGPICEDLTLVGNPPNQVFAQEIKPFQDAFDCLTQGNTISTAIPSMNGSTWDKPLRCVAGSISRPIRSAADCQTFAANNSLLYTNSTDNLWYVNNECVVVGANAATCTNLTGTRSTVYEVGIRFSPNVGGISDASVCTNLAQDVQTLLRGTTGFSNTITVSGTISSTCQLAFVPAATNVTAATSAAVLTVITNANTALANVTNIGNAKIERSASTTTGTSNNLAFGSATILALGTGDDKSAVDCQEVIDKINNSLTSITGIAISGGDFVPGSEGTTGSDGNCDVITASGTGTFTGTLATKSKAVNDILSDIGSLVTFSGTLTTPDLETPAQNNKCVL